MAQKNQKPQNINTVMRTITSQVTGERLVIDQSSFVDEMQYAVTRTVRSDASVSTNFRRQAALGGGYGGGGNNTNITPPNFYSPFTTASSYQIPNARNDVYTWAEYWYLNEPKIAAGINFYGDFPFSGFELECSNGYVKDYFEKLVAKLNFAHWLPDISREYHLRGDVFPFLTMDCDHCKGSGYTEQGDKCEHAGATWRSISILNPDMVEISLTFLDQLPTYTYKPTEEMVKIVQEKQPKHIYDSISDEVKKKIIARQPIPLSEESIWHFKRAAAPWHTRRAAGGSALPRRDRCRCPARRSADLHWARK